MSKKFLYVDAGGVYTEANGYEQSDFINSSAGVADAGKPVVLDAAGLIDSSMVDESGIDHGSIGGLGDDDHTIYSLVDGSRDYSAVVAYASHPSFTLDNQIVDKKYVDDIVVSSEWYPYSALDYVVDNTLAPATEVDGDVYILSHDGGVPHANFDGASAGDIVKFDGSVWVATTPTTGTKVSVDDEPNTAYYLWSGSSYSQKLLETSTASTGLVKVGQDIRMDASAGGDGLGFAAGVLSVNVDDSSIEINSDILRVKALGITDAMLAGSISDGKLTEDYIKTSEVDDTSVEFSGGTLNVKADGINDLMIDWGTGLNQVSAADVPIADAGGYTAESDVEGALQELYSLNAAVGVNYTSAGVTKGDLVYVSANDTVTTYGTITTGVRAIGPAATTVAAAGTVKVLANDTVLTGVLSGATAGTVYYWDGSSLVTSIPTTSGGYVWQLGVAKNATDLHVECRLIKKNI